jgi:4-hydroxymandelate oxidase
MLDRPTHAGPVHAGPVHARPVYVHRVVHRAYPDDCAYLGSAGHRAEIGTYLSDLLRPYGAALAADRLEAGAGQSYGEMAADLIAAVVSPDEPVDVLVLAFAVPDVRPGRATATYLSHVCPGRPFAFAVCDQGVAAAYTGLRLVGEYLGRGPGRRGLLLVVEQPVLHYAPVGPTELPAAPAAVALLCGGPAAPGPVLLGPVRVRADVAPGRVPAVLAADLPRDDAPVRVIAGGGLPRAAHPAEARPGPTGQPGTGVWAGLAAALAGPAPPARIVLADYEPDLRYLCTATVEYGPGR